MIERDRGDDGEPRVGEVGGVEASAHADLEHGEIDLPPREVQEGGEGHGLEVGRAGVAEPRRPRRGPARAGGRESAAGISAPATRIRSSTLSRWGEV